MKVRSTLLTASTLCLSLGSASALHAATISGSLGEYNAYFEYRLEDTTGVTGDADDSETTDWVTYSTSGVATNPYNTKSAVTSFSALSGLEYNQATNGVVKLGHPAAYDQIAGSAIASTDTVTYPDANVGAMSDDEEASLSFTHTLLGQSETLLIYLHGLDSDQTSYDITASIAGSATTAYAHTDIALPTNRVDGAGNRDGDYGLLTLTITDAAPGDVLTFTFATDYSEEVAAEATPDGGWGVAIGGASVTVTEAFVPEPASLALLGLGGCVLAFRRRSGV